MPDRKSKLEMLCAERGLKMTDQRRVIARVLSEASDHPDVESVHRRATAIDPNMQALMKLYGLYQARRDTPGLCRVSRALYQLNPNDSIGANNFAYYSLLLSLDRAIAEQLTKENFAKDRKNPAFLLTYVFLLYQQGRNEEALKLFDGLSEEELREGRLPFVYGLIAAAGGKPELAKQFLDLAEKNPDLLPEEKSLISQASKPVKPASRSQTTPVTRRN
jgi:tetratricopeptide (TPR) repeat protein